MKIDHIITLIDKFEAAVGWVHNEEECGIDMREHTKAVKARDEARTKLIEAIKSLK